MPRAEPDPESIDLADLPQWVERPDYVSASELNRFRSLKGVQSALQKLHPTGWGEEELRLYLIGLRKRKAQELLASLQSKKLQELDDHTKVDVIVRGYLEFFSNPSPNDLVMLRELARIQLSLDRLEGMQAENKKSKPADEKTMAQVRRDLVKSFQETERTLGIDRESRSEETDTVVELERIKKEALYLLERRSRRLTCAHCSTVLRQVNLGLVMWHFDGQLPFRFEAECPTCHKRLLVDGGLSPREA